MRQHAQFALSLVLVLAGAAGALLCSLPTWQVITVGRPGLGTVVVAMTGRDVDAAATALALVALAGVVAILATKGLWRRLVGAVIAAAGLGLVWRGVVSAPAVDAARARSFVQSHRSTVAVDAGVVPHVDIHPVWPILTIVCGVIVLAAGALVAVRGGRWRSMSARYEAPPGTRPDAAEPDDTGDAERSRAAASLWTSLDRGEDPTA